MFLFSEALAARQYSPQHPFKPERARLTRELCTRRGYLGKPWMTELDPPAAPAELLEAIHEDAYLGVLRRASVGDIDERTIRHGLGMSECPIFPGLWDYCLESAGIAVAAIEALLDDQVDLAFSPAGGMHHALPDMATGFCYVNDVALACHIAAERGFRVAYVDVDAHHGNGVQNIFWEDPRVLVTSLHETGRTLYPWCGFADEVGAGKGLGYTVNIPFEPDTDDATLMWAYEKAIRPRLEAFEPDVLVVELGADGMSVDPLTHLKYTNNGLADITSALMRMAPKVLITGGGGYDIEATTKAWALCWSVMNGLEPIDDPYVTMGGVFLGEASLVGGSLRDMNIYLSGPDRERVRAAAEEAVGALESTTFPAVRGA